jgi:hypothetical protein
MDAADSSGFLTVEKEPAAVERFELVYAGPDVDDGSMDARQLADVLTGMTRAFSTIAYEEEFEGPFRLRVADIESHSFHILFQAIEFAKCNPGAAAAIATGAAVGWKVLTDTASGAYKILKDIAAYIDTKKKLKGARIATTETKFEENQVRLILPGELILLTKEQYELLLGKKIDKPVSQVISPLLPKRIDTFRVRHANTDLVKVEAAQREYFQYSEPAEEEVKDGGELEGVLDSLTKSKLRGTFHTVEGVHVPYKYVGDDVPSLLRGFAAREKVRVFGRVKYSSDGVPSFVDVQDVRVLQSGLF